MTAPEADKPVFPIRGMNDHPGPLGISLRDYFAAKVVQGLCTPNPEDGDPRTWKYSAIAECAYKAADAMLVERCK